MAAKTRAQLLRLLKRGCDAWNNWRNTEPGEIGLSGVNLSGYSLWGMNLRKVYFRKAVLSGANLNGSDLSFSSLEDADLEKASLERTNLTYANLYGAHLPRAHLPGAILHKAQLACAFFESANLSDADLTFAQLTNTNFQYTNLLGANFSHACFDVTIFGGTILGSTNFSNAEGLISCRHRGPSTIDHNTIIRSGYLPVEFLRGCGLPDIFIEYLSALPKQPFQFFTCFISYSAKDVTFVEKLYGDLQNHGVRCWYAPDDLKIGDRFRSKIDETILVHDRLLLILSQHSISSQWVEKEVETALEQERIHNRSVLFPIRLDDAVLNADLGWAADIRRTRHIGDFRGWENPGAYQKAVDRLLRDLKVE